MKKVILWCPAGRQKYMEVQIHYVKKLIEKYDFIERYDIWDVSWSSDDSKYLKTLNKIHSKISIRETPYENAKRAGEIASKQFAYIYHDAYPSEKYYDYIFVKLDDDIIYLDVDNFDKFIEIRSKDESSFLVSANVINNNYKDHHSVIKIHDEFFKEFDYFKNKKIDETNNEIFACDHRLSINFASYLGSDLHHIKSEFSNGIGSNDEWRLSSIIPKRLNKQNLIVSDYYVSHFTFGGQLKKMKNANHDYILKKYKEMGETEK